MLARAPKRNDAARLVGVYAPTCTIQDRLVPEGRINLRATRRQREFEGWPQ